jgi:glutamyl/glutaminyl-tRNA synthetase
MMVTRLAPTPSGFLHAGNIYNFLLNWLWARANNGTVLLRIDDMDAARKRPEYVNDIFTTLAALGLDWDMGPSGPDDFEKNWRQQQRLPLYNQILDIWVQQDKMFVCTCSRQQLLNNQHCHCETEYLPWSTAHAAWRMKLYNPAAICFTDKQKGAVEVMVTDSFIIRKKDGLPAYQLCSLMDDRHFGVTHICRGEDLLPSTAMQLWLDAQLTTPYLRHCHLWHHPLLTLDGDKISKSAGAQSSSLMKDVKKEALLAGFARWMGWPAMDSLEALQQQAIFRKAAAL